jgi:hypothetical protein
LGAILVFNSVRLICPLLGVGSSESLFVAGMLVASSSAMIGKILEFAIRQRVLVVGGDNAAILNY